MKPAATDAPPYRTNVPPAPATVPPPESRAVGAVAGLLLGCTAMMALTAWWWLYVGEQFPIRVY